MIAFGLSERVDSRLRGNDRACGPWADGFHMRGDGHMTPGHIVVGTVSCGQHLFNGSNRSHLPDTFAKRIAVHQKRRPEADRITRNGRTVKTHGRNVDPQLAPAR